MAAKKSVTKKSSGKKAPVVTEGAKKVEENLSVVQEVRVREGIVDERIELGNEVLSAVNDALTGMAKRGIAPELIESAFYLAFQFAFCDFIRTTGFPFDDAVADLRDMYSREMQESHGEAKTS